jgi:hypothetical protein
MPIGEINDCPRDKQKELMSAKTVGPAPGCSVSCQFSHGHDNYKMKRMTDRLCHYSRWSAATLGVAMIRAIILMAACSQLNACQDPPGNALTGTEQVGSASSR